MDSTVSSTGTLASARLTIDLGALAANWRTMRERSGKAEAGAVVKANAYGIGTGPAVRALFAAGCKTFFVATFDEAREARAAAPGAVVYLLSGLLPGSAPALAALGVRPVLGSLDEVAEWAAWREKGGGSEVALHVDTGMNRLGLSPLEAHALAADRDLARAIAPALLMSHLASADLPGNKTSAKQLALFREVRRLFPGVPASLANSAGIMLGPDYHFDLTRPGIMLYGAEASSEWAPLRPVATAEARVLLVRDVAAGEAVGYGGEQTMTRPSRIATLGAGYADGYHRITGSSDTRLGGRVAIDRRIAPLVGRVSMDLMTADVTDFPNVARGDWVELFGPTIPVDEAAAVAGTIGYEFLTGLGRRYERRYVGV
jgi:alanine racemase